MWHDKVADRAATSSQAFAICFIAEPPIRLSATYSAVAISFQKALAYQVRSGQEK